MSPSYYGRTLEEISPKYLAHEISMLMEYQTKATRFYQKSLELDKKAEAIRREKSALSALGTTNCEVKKEIRLSKRISSLEFRSLELRKDASRHLREGSRTVGSLILCKDLPKIKELFQLSAGETEKANASTKVLRALERVMRLLEEVGLKREHYYVYPHTLSGGQKQRVGIARAIALNPKFVVLDECVSALNVSVQAQILQLLNELSAGKNLTYFFITHDLGVVRHFCDRIVVMYLGNVCEVADSSDLFHEPLHPYTRSLLAVVPRLRVGEHSTELVLDGDVPSAMHPPKGCPFHTRCADCMEICREKKPVPREVSSGHVVACHLYK